MLRAVAILGWLGVASTGSAEPRPVRSAAVEPAEPAFAWTAPPRCPDAAAVKLRIEHRLGVPLDGNLHGIEIVVTKESGGFVARIDARAITVANDVRTLRDRRCAALADAVSVVLARLANEVLASRASAPAAAPVAMTALATTVAYVEPVASAEPDADPVMEHIVEEVTPPPPPSRWGGGIHVLALTGVGALPQINVGVELAVHARRDNAFGSLGVSRWVPQNARIAPGAPGGVEVRLDTLTLRGGWGPRVLPLRAWLLAELGHLQGSGSGLDAERTGTVPWTAVGAGFGVGWPISVHTRLIGTFEVAVPLQRPRFMLDQGADVYQPGAAAARCALGLEVGWP